MNVDMSVYFNFLLTAGLSRKADLVVPVPPTSCDAALAPDALGVYFIFVQSNMFSKTLYFFIFFVMFNNTFPSHSLA